MQLGGREGYKTWKGDVVEKAKEGRKWKPVLGMEAKIGRGKCKSANDEQV